MAKVKKSNQAIKKIENPKASKAEEIPGKLISQHRLFPLLVLLCLWLAGVASYYPSFNVPFVFDDLRVITQDREVQIQTLNLGSLQPLLRKSRPVAILSFALNYYCGQLNVFGYHLVNLVLHVLTGFVIYLLIDATLKLPLLASEYTAIAPTVASSCALLFVVHPVNTQAVTYVVQRMCSLAAFFFLLSILFYVWGRLKQGGKRLTLYGLSALSGILALASKENAATLPVFIGLYEVYFFQGLDWQKIKKQGTYLVALIVMPVLSAAYYFNLATSLQSVGQYTLTEKLLTELRVLFYYFSLLIFPHPGRLNLDYDFPLSHSLFAPPTTFIALLGLLALIFCIFYFARKAPLFSFAILWFIGNLIIESTVIPLEIIYEHRLYLPAVWFFVVVILLYLKLSGTCFKKKAVNIGLLLIIVTTWGAWTYQRNLVWQSSFSLWQDIVNKSPNNGRAHDNLALAYFRSGDYDKAIAEHEKGIQLGGPGLVKKLNNLGNAYFKRNRLDDALHTYKRAVRLDPNFVEARNGLGVVYNAKGLYADAERELLKVLELEPHHPGAYSNLGMVYANMNQPVKAAQVYQKALADNPGDIKSHYGLGKAYAQQKLYPQAISEYRLTLTQEPQNQLVYNSLGAAYAETGKYREAEGAFLFALALDSNFFEARKHLGNIYYLLQNNDKALREWKRALPLDSNDQVLAKNIAIVERRMETSKTSPNQPPGAIKQ